MPQLALDVEHGGKIRFTSHTVISIAWHRRKLRTGPYAAT
jgi:hypothetical protein